MARETIVQKVFTEWCAGLPLVGYRPLTSDEMHFLRRRNRRTGWTASGLILIGPTIIALCCSMGAGPLRTDRLGSFLYFCLFIGTLVCFPTLYFGFARLNRFHRVVKDLQLGFARKFEGELAVRIPGDETQKKLIEQGLVAFAQGVNQSIELLASSTQILSANGLSLPSELIATTTRVGAAPSTLITQPSSVEVAGSRAAAGVLERPLSAAELAEIRRHIDRSWWRHCPGTVVGSAMFGLSAASFWCAPEIPDRPFQLAIVIVFGVLMLMSDYALVRGIAVAWALYQDSRKGVVHVAAILSDKPIGEIAESPSQGSEKARGIPIEVLAVSGWSWTVNREPAAWRRSAG